MCDFFEHTYSREPPRRARIASIADPEREGGGEGGEGEGGLAGQRAAQGGRRRQEGLQRRRVPEADLRHARTKHIGFLVEETVGLAGEKQHPPVSLCALSVGAP